MSDPTPTPSTPPSAPRRTVTRGRKPADMIRLADTVRTAIRTVPTASRADFTRTVRQAFADPAVLAAILAIDKLGAVHPGDFDAAVAFANRTPTNG